MAKLDKVVGSTGQTLDVFIQDNSVTTGAGLTGLVHNSAGLSCYYYRQGAASATSVSLVDATVGTWTSGGFKAVDGTNAPGLYQFGIPNAALASGAQSVKFYFKGATNMAPVVAEIQLSAGFSLDAAVPAVNATQLAGQTITAAAGVTFPSSVASPTNITAGTITTVTNLTNAPTAGDFTSTMKTSIGTAVAASAVASVTGNVGGNVSGNVSGSVGSVTGNVGGNVIGTIGGHTAGAKAEILTEVNAALDAAVADSIPADGSRGSVRQILYIIGQFLTDRTVSGTTMTIRKVDGSTALLTLTLNDATNPTSITRA